MSEFFIGVVVGGLIVVGVSVFVGWVLVRGIKEDDDVF